MASGSDSVGSVLWLEPEGGVAGDMLLAALLDVGAAAAPIEAAFASLGMQGLSLHHELVDVAGAPARYVRSLAPRREHHHAHLHDILELIERAETTAPARRLATRAFTLLCEAEAAVHGGSAEDVHLHEVGELDSIMDVLGVATAYDALGGPPIRCGVLPSGQGSIDAAHGRMPLPVPAVRALSERHAVPLATIEERGETVTPTGLALLVAMNAEFRAELAPRPDHAAAGAGTRRYAKRRNVLWAWWAADRRGADV